MKEETEKEGGRECFVSKPEIAATFAFSDGRVNELLSILHERLMCRISKSVELELKLFGTAICREVGDEMDAGLRKAQEMANAMMTAANAAKDEVNKMKAKMGK